MSQDERIGAIDALREHQEAISALHVYYTKQLHRIQEILEKINECRDSADDLAKYILEIPQSSTGKVNE